MSQPPDESAIRFVDNPYAPELLADEAIGFFMHNGIISITLAAPRVNHMSSPGPINRVVVARIAMPLAGAQNLAVGLYDFLAKLGHEPQKAAGAGSLQ